MKTETKPPNPAPQTNNYSDGQKARYRKIKLVGIPRDLHEEIRVLSERVGINPDAVVIGAARLVVKRLKAGAALALTQDGVTLVEVQRTGTGSTNP